mmetsp:Transcript_27712/g.27406  ORF Transcript_27712/g.27406 Transcript_27712/m.27406 type:complete len:256 (-) Transcript_27712:386-1153(-)
MTVLGRGVDEAQLDLLEGIARHLLDARLAESDNAFLHSGNTALHHDVVLIDLTVVGEASHGGDGLLGQIGLGGGVGVEGLGVVLALSVSVHTLANAVDLLVHLSSVMVSVLTGAGHGELHTGGVPSADTGHLAQTAVSLAGQAGHTPTGDNSLVSATLGDRHSVNHLVGAEHAGHRHALLEESLAPVNLGGRVTSVDLDLRQVSLLLAQLDLLDISVADQSDHLAEFLHALKLLLGVFVVLLSSAVGIAIKSLFL